jgi:CheY-like chemotaxis protein
MVTDIQMPGSMDGVELPRAVRARWPSIKIIVVSGGALTIVAFTSVFLRAVDATGEANLAAQRRSNLLRR